MRAPTSSANSTAAVVMTTVLPTSVRVSWQIKIAGREKGSCRPKGRVTAQQGSLAGEAEASPGFSRAAHQATLRHNTDVGFSAGQQMFHKRCSQAAQRQGNDQAAHRQQQENGNDGLKTSEDDEGHDERKLQVAELCQQQRYDQWHHK